jgi:hypothetical protein
VTPRLSLPGIYALDDPNVTLENPSEMVALEDPFQIQLCAEGSIEPRRIRRVRWKIHGRAEDDQEDGLVELPEELTDTGDLYAEESFDPRQAQLET